MKKLTPKTVNKWNWILWAAGALIALLGPWANRIRLRSASSVFC